MTILHGNSPEILELLKIWNLPTADLVKFEFSVEAGNVAIVETTHRRVVSVVEYQNFVDVLNRFELHHKP